MKAVYLYANGLLLAKIETTPPGAPRKYFYHHDGLGSIIGMTDTQGSVVQSYRYDEFGRLLQEASPTGPHSNYKYTAQEYDATISELYNYRARYYDTEIGRFTQEDPELQCGYSATSLSRASCGVGRDFPSWFVYRVNPQGLNAYPYVLNNPPNLTDPTGERVVVCDKLRTTIPMGVHQYLRFEGGPYSGQAWGFVQASGFPLPPRWMRALVRDEEKGGRCYFITNNDCMDECVHAMILDTKRHAEAGRLRYHVQDFNCRDWVTLVRDFCGI